MQIASRFLQHYNYKEAAMAGFTERRVAENRSMIPPAGDRRRQGKGRAERIDPTVEETYWRTQYTREPYFERGYTFDDYYPAYRTGWEGRARYQDRTYEQVERDLQRDYQRNRGSSQLDWPRNRHAVRAAWERFD
jgi:hypothetical protein